MLKEIPAPFPNSSAERAAVVTKAVVRASDRLGISAKALARTIGLSEATVSRMRSGDYLLDAMGKPFELSLLLVRLFRSLDAITGGDESTARAWLSNRNAVLGDAPISRIQTIAGLSDVIAYLDARRARI
jgi:ribosome-binding protein aMBF1 (putative translation factor)